MAEVGENDEGAELTGQQLLTSNIRWPATIHDIVEHIGQSDNDGADDIGPQLHGINDEVEHIGQQLHAMNDGVEHIGQQLHAMNDGVEHIGQQLHGINDGVEHIGQQLHAINDGVEHIGQHHDNIVNGGVEGTEQLFLNDAIEEIAEINAEQRQAANNEVENGGQFPTAVQSFSSLLRTVLEPIDNIPFFALYLSRKALVLLLTVLVLLCIALYLCLPFDKTHDVYDACVLMVQDEEVCPYLRIAALVAALVAIGGYVMYDFIE